MTATAEIIDGTAAAVRAGRRARTRRRTVAVAALVILLIGLSIAMLTLGNTVYPLGDVIAVMLGYDVPGASFTVGTLRIPRTLTGVLAGIAFGVGMILLSGQVLAACLGLAVFHAWKRHRPAHCDKRAQLFGAALLAGDGLAGVLQSCLEVAGVAPPFTFHYPAWWK